MYALIEIFEHSFKFLILHHNQCAKAGCSDAYFILTTCLCNLFIFKVLAEDGDVVSTLSTQTAPLPFDVSRLYVR